MPLSSAARGLIQQPTSYNCHTLQQERLDSNLENEKHGSCRPHTRIHVGRAPTHTGTPGLLLCGYGLSTVKSGQV